MVYCFSPDTVILKLRLLILNENPTSIFLLYLLFPCPTAPRPKATYMF